MTNAYTMPINESLRTTKHEFMLALMHIYRIGNIADHESNPNTDWTNHHMAGDACCQHIDKMINSLIERGIFDDTDRDAFYANL